MSDRQDFINSRLEEFYSSELTRAEIVELILTLDRRWWKFVLDWLVAIAKTDPEVGYHFVRRVGTALHSLGPEGCEQWLQSALDAYDADGQAAAIASLQELDQFIASQRKQSRGLAFADIRNVFSLFLQAN